MKKNLLKLVGIIIALFIVGCSNLWATCLKKTEENHIKRKNAIQVVHHVVWINASLKKETLDIYDLEFLYNQLIPENVSINILDNDTLDYLSDMLREINNLRIDHKERELLNEIYEDEKNRALWACLPNNMAVLVDFNWKQVIANVAQTAFYSWMNYKNIKESLEIQFKKDTWALDKQRLIEVCKKNSKDLESLFKIYKNNKIPDQDIVTKAEDLFEKISKVVYYDTPKSPLIINPDDLISERFNIWNEIKTKGFESKYKNFAPYWYYRGILAYYYEPQENISENNVKLTFHKNSDLDDADYCFSKYQELTQTPVLTKLPTVAEVALRRIQIAMSKDTDEEFLREQLKLIEKHSNIGKSFDRYLFCGLVYYHQLKDYSKAAEMFHEAESALGSKYRKDFKNFIKALDINKEYDIKEKYGSKGKYIEAVIGKGDNGSDKKDEIDKDLYLPSGDLLFFAQMAKYHSKIKANEDANLVDEINKTVSSFPPLWQHFFLLLA